MNLMTRMNTSKYEIEYNSKWYVIANGDLAYALRQKESNGQ